MPCQFDVVFKILYKTSLMGDPTATSTHLLETIDENDDEYLDSSLLEAETKFNSVNERFVALKALVESLTETLKNEKELWNKELQETLKLERQMRSGRYISYPQEITLSANNYDTKISMFHDFLLFCEANKNIQATRKNNYRQWLTEVDSKCSIELDRIEKSLMALKPLKDMLKWQGDESGDWKVQINTEKVVQEMNDERSTIETIEE